MNWVKLDQIENERLFQARAQLHQAVQLLTATGISFVSPRPDDSHTAITWNPDSNDLMSQAFGKGDTFRVSLRPLDLSLRVFHGDDTPMEMNLNGVTLKQAATDLLFFLEDHGLPAGSFTMERHFELPDYPSRWETAFDVSDSGAFQSLSSSYSNAFQYIQDIAQSDPRASSILVWPHHFDLATLIDLGAGKSIGIGISPGDDSYTAPYYYVNVWPYPSAEQVLELPLKQGQWHTAGWTGIVLTFEEIAAESNEVQQFEMVKAFLKQALSHSEKIGTSN